jgi:tetratricopeptide (TPR) repeat protein
LAVVLYQHAWLTHARSSISRSIDLFEGLVQEFHDNVSYREGLAGALTAYVAVLQNAGTENFRPIVERAFQIARSPGVYKRFLGHAYESSGSLAVSKGQWDEAEAVYLQSNRAFGEAVAERPTDGRTREHYMVSCQNLASVYERQGEVKPTEHWYRNAIQLGEELTHDFPSMRLFRDKENQIVAAFVKFLKKQNRSDDATELLAHLAPLSVQDFAERARLYSLLGQKELAKADYQEAIDRSQRAIQSDPSSPEPYRALFDGLTGLGRRDEALDTARNMPTHDVESLGVRTELYSEFKTDLTPEDKKVMVDLHSQLIKAIPTHLDEVVEQARACVESGQYDSALLLANIVFDTDSNSPYARSVRGYIYAKLRNYDEALADCSEAIRLDPTNSTLWNIRSVVHYDFKQFDKAIEDSTQAIRLEPSERKNYPNRANANYKLKYFDKAVEDWTALIQKYPRDANSLSNRGNSYRELREYANAVNDYQAALGIDNKYWAARINLAWLLATAGDEQFRDGKRAVELAQSTYDAGDFGSYGEARFLRILAAAHAEAGDFDKAIEYCQKAISLVSDKDKEEEWAKELPAQLECYQAGRPWRIGAGE